MLTRLFIATLPAFLLVWGLHASGVWSPWEMAWDTAWQQFTAAPSPVAEKPTDAASMATTGFAIFGFLFWSFMGAAAGMLKGRLMPIFGLWVTLLLVGIGVFIPDWMHIPWPDVATISAVLFGWVFSVGVGQLPLKPHVKSLLRFWFQERISPVAIDSALSRSDASVNALLQESNQPQPCGIVEIGLSWSDEAGEIPVLEQRNAWNELERRAREVWMAHPCWKSNQMGTLIQLICGFPAVVPDPEMAARRLSEELEESLKEWVLIESPHLLLDLSHRVENLITGPVGDEWKVLKRQHQGVKKD